MSRWILRSRNPPIPFELHDIIRSDVWKDLAAGDRVEVTDLERYPNYARTKWEFVSHYTNMRSGKQAIELWGGTRGNEMMVAVGTHAVRKLTRGRNS